MKYIQQSEVDWSQEEKVSKGTGSRCFSLQWSRWTTIKVWQKFDTTWTSQGSYHTQILGDLIKIHCIGAVESSLRRKDCNFIKHDHTQSFSTTLPCDLYWKAVCMKTQEVLHHRVFQSPRLPRVILKPNSQSGHQDQHEHEARKSSHHQSVSGSYGETRNGNVDCRIQCLPKWLPTGFFFLWRLFYRLGKTLPEPVFSLWA